MPRSFEGDLDASRLRFAIIASRFNDEIVSGLLAGALEALKRNGADDSNVTVYRCPGAFEIPTVARKLCTAGGIDAIVALGCLLRGDTLHFEILAQQVTTGLSRVAVDAEFPIAFGVLTCDTYEQAEARSGSGEGNKGFE